MTVQSSLKFAVLTLGTCAAALCASSAQAETFSDAQKKEIEVLFKEFLSDNPQLILDSVDSYRAQEEQRTKQSAQEKLAEYSDYFAQADLPSAGNPDGDVTVVEYFDYNCGYCRKAFADIQVLMKDDKNVRVVFQEMPILSPSSQLMAEYALAAKRQGKYFEMHTAIMDYKGPQNAKAYEKLGKELGLDIEKLRADAKSDAVKEEIDVSRKMANELGIRGTPGFIIGDEIFPGYIGIQALKDGVQAARDKQSAE